MSLTPELSAGPRNATTEDYFHVDLPGGQRRRVRWGKPWEYQTPAYWVSLTQERTRLPLGDRPHRLADTFVEEVVACLLGGHGISYEVNLAALNALRDAGLFSWSDAAEADIREVLTAPLNVNGRSQRYRFPNQKAARIHSALVRLADSVPPSEPLNARNWLMTFDGIGPKTASWVVRNQYDAPDIAIIDIHVLRAGRRAGVFDERWEPSQHYWSLESAFVEWATHGGVRAADLDAVVWTEQARAARRSREH